MIEYSVEIVYYSICVEIIALLTDNQIQHKGRYLIKSKDNISIVLSGIFGNFLDGCECCSVNDIDILQWGEAY